MFALITAAFGVGNTTTNPSDLQPGFCADIPNFLLQLDADGVRRALTAELADNSVEFRTLIQLAGAEPAIDPDILYSSTRDYLVGMAPVWAPVLTFAVLAVLCWLPLCIGRCCAHRCCAPKETYRPGCGVLNWATFIVLSTALLACAITGVIAGSDVNGALDKMVCGAAALVEDAYVQFGKLSGTCPPTCPGTGFGLASAFVRMVTERGSIDHVVIPRAHTHY